MARARKHESTREIALRRVEAGESIQSVARDMGIKPPTLSSWRSRGGGGPPMVSGEARAHRRETAETPGVDLSDAVKRSVESAEAHLRTVAGELDRLAADPDNGVALAALRIRLAEAWGGLAKTAIAAGLPKVTVTTEASVRGTSADIELLREVNRMTGAATPQALEADDAEQG